MKNTNWNDQKERKYKQLSRELATSFSIRKTTLFMPAQLAMCVQTAEKNGMLEKNRTELVLVERDPEKVEILKENVLNWKKEIFPQELHTVDLGERKLDYAWIDLTGTISQKIASWIKHHLSTHISKDGILCFTQGYCWRNNPWLKKLHKYVLDNHYEEYSVFRQNVGVFQDQLMTFPVFLISCLMREWEIYVLEPYRYRDTIDMVLFRFKLLKKKGPTLPFLPLGEPQPKKVKSTQKSVSFTKQRTISMTKTNASTVITAIFTASSPAHKAHATRKLNAYVAEKVKEGKKESQVRAAIAAHVTRRRNAAV